MTEWQQLCEAIASPTLDGERRWYILNRQQREGAQMKQVKVKFEFDERSVAPGPFQSFDEAVTEAEIDLWALGMMTEPRPVGADEPAYVAPAHRWLLCLYEAQLPLTEAAHAALGEVPADLRRKAEAQTRATRDGWQTLAEQSPEVRRMMQVETVRLLLETLIDELENEGRPQPPLDLSLKKHRGR